MAVEQYGAQFFGTGATLSGVITMPGGPLKAREGEADPIERLREQFGLDLDDPTLSLLHMIYSIKAVQD